MHTEISEGNTRQWHNEFSDIHTNIQDEERSERPSAQKENFVEQINAEIQENQWFTISTVALEFPNISQITVHRSVTETWVVINYVQNWTQKC